MPPYFQFESPPTPYTETIARLMMQPAQYQGEAAMYGAAARARAAELGGLARAQIGQSIGQAAVAIARAPQEARDEEMRRQMLNSRAALEAEQVAHLHRQNVEAEAQKVLQGKLGAVLSAGLQSGTEQSPYDITAMTKLLKDDPSLAVHAPELLESARKTNEGHQAFLDKQDQSEQAALRNAADIASRRGGTLDDFLVALEPHVAFGRVRQPVGELYLRQLTAMSPEDRTKQIAAWGTPPEYKAVGAGGLAQVSAGGEIKVIPPFKEEKQATNEWESYQRATAKAAGVAKFEDLPAKAQMDAIGQFKVASADPALREAALAQKNIAYMLAQAQLNMMPTKEQAASVADDLVNHRVAPEQLASLFSTRGKEGLAFKLAVTAEAKKLDPKFNFEEASANYQLVKSTGFQNTVRYMDSVTESMPRLLENAKKLGNTNVKFVNGIRNYAKGQISDPTLKAFVTDAILVGDEGAKILQGGGTGSATSDAKLKQMVEIIDKSEGVPAIASALSEINALIGYRRHALTRGTYMERAGGGGGTEPETFGRFKISVRP